MLYYTQLRWRGHTQTFVNMLGMYSLHPLVNSVDTRMSVPVCPPKQYSSSENGLPGPENLNVKSSMLLLIPFSTVPSVFK